MALLIAIPQLDGLVLAGRRPRWDGRPPRVSVGKPDIRFDGRIPAGVQDLTSNHFRDRRQVMTAFELGRFQCRNRTSAEHRLQVSAHLR